MSNPRNIPTYEKSVGLQVTEQPNPEGAASMMINSFRNFSETTAALVQGVTKEVATQERETLKNNISNTYRQFALDALKNPDQNAALSEYTQKSKDYANGLMQQTNRFNKPYVNNLVDYYHNEHLFSIEKNAIAQNQRMLSIEAYKNINDATRDWKDAINNSKPMVDSDGNDVQFDAARALLADQLRSMEQYAKVKGFDPAMMNKARETIIKDYTTSEYIKRYEDAVQQGLGNQFIAKMKDVGFHIPGMSDDEKATVINKMIHIRDQGISGAKTAIGQLQYRMKDNLLQVSKGAMPDDGLQSDLDALDPIRGAAYKEQVDIAQASYSAKQATAYKSPSEKSEYLKSLYDIDPNDKDAAKRYRIADASAKAIAAQDNEIKANPLEFVMRDPSVQEAVNSYEQAFNADAVGTDLKYTPINSKVQKPWQTIIDKQLHLGMTLNGKKENSVRLIDEKKVGSMVNEAMQAQGRDKVLWVNKLSDEYGGGLPFNLVMKQLVRSGLPANYALLAGIDPDSPDAAMVADSLSVPPSEVSKELDTRVPKSSTYIKQQSLNHVFSQDESGTNNLKSFLSTIPNYNDAASTNFRREMASNISQIANYLALTQNMDKDDALAKAENIVSDRYQYMSMSSGKMIDRENFESTLADKLYPPSMNMIRLPKDVNGVAVQSYAKTMRSKLFEFPFNIDGYDKVRAQTLIAKGHWANDSNDDGLVWVDANGKMWTDKDGHPYSFSFSNADVNFHPHKLQNEKKLESPQMQEDIENDSIQNQEDEIDRIGVEKLKQGQAAGKRMRALIKSGQEIK